MSAANIQLIKWTFPAFAFIIGFLWYKRRGVNRVDPGGNTKADKDLSNIAIDDKNNKSTKAIKNQTKNGLTLYDSGIHIDEFSSPMNINSTKFNRIQEEVISSPRKVSDNLDIPIKKSSPHSLSMRSGEKRSWYADEDDEFEDMPEVNEVILGSKPKTSSFDLMMLNKPPVFDVVHENKENNINNNKVNKDEFVERIDDDSNHQQQQEQQEQQPSVTVSGQTRSSSVSIETCEKPMEEVSADETKTRGQAISERDSANHSPVSGVLDGSVNDDIQSEGSTDSGKGGSINGQLLKVSTLVYKFEIPQYIVGKFIGRRGVAIQELNNKTGVNVTLKNHPNDRNLKLCSIQGLPENVNAALDIVRQRFPVKKYPTLTLEQYHVTISVTEELGPWIDPGYLYLHLIAGVNNDVTLCNILEPNRLFIQLPTHPSYNELRSLVLSMTEFYNTVDSPPVPDQLCQGMVVVAKWYDTWVRAWVEQPDPNGQQHIVRLVDHGGFWSINHADMRKIISDFLTLPFQAIEVSIAHIKPAGGEWAQEAYDTVAELCGGSALQAHIEGYVDSVVYVSLYLISPKHGIISLADELLARGYAEPASIDELACLQFTQQQQQV